MLFCCMGITAVKSTCSSWRGREGIWAVLLRAVSQCYLMTAKIVSSIVMEISIYFDKVKGVKPFFFFFNPRNPEAVYLESQSSTLLSVGSASSGGLCSWILALFLIFLFFFF